MTRKEKLVQSRHTAWKVASERAEEVSKYMLLADQNAALVSELRDVLKLVAPLKKHGRYFEKPHTPSSNHGREHADLVALVSAVDIALAMTPVGALTTREQRVMALMKEHGFACEGDLEDSVRQVLQAYVTANRNDAIAVKQLSTLSSELCDTAKEQIETAHKESEDNAAQLDKTYDAMAKLETQLQEEKKRAHKAELIAAARAEWIRQWAQYMNSAPSESSASTRHRLTIDMDAAVKQEISKVIQIGVSRVVGNYFTCGEGRATVDAAVEASLSAVKKSLAEKE
jgi:hypothetical protein